MNKIIYHESELLSLRHHNKLDIQLNLFLGRKCNTWSRWGHKTVNRSEQLRNDKRHRRYDNDSVKYYYNLSKGPVTDSWVCHKKPDVFEITPAHTHNVSLGQILLLPTIPMDVKLVPLCPSIINIGHDIDLHTGIPISLISQDIGNTDVGCFDPSDSISENVLQHSRVTAHIPIVPKLDIYNRKSPYPFSSSSNKVHGMNSDANVRNSFEKDNLQQSRTTVQSPRITKISTKYGKSENINPYSKTGFFPDYVKFAVSNEKPCNLQNYSNDSDGQSTVGSSCDSFNIQIQIPSMS